MKAGLDCRCGYWFGLATFLVLVTTFQLPRAAESTSSCSVTLPTIFPNGSVSWPVSWLVEQPISVCIRPGTYQNVSLTFSGTLQNLSSSVLVQPQIKDSTVIFEGGANRALTFREVSIVQISGIGFRNSTADAGGCLAIFSSDNAVLEDVHMSGCSVVAGTSFLSYAGGGGSFICVNCSSVSLIRSTIIGGTVETSEERANEGEGEGDTSMTADIGGLVLLIWMGGDGQQVLLENSSLTGGKASTLGGGFAGVFSCEKCGNGATFVFKESVIDGCSSGDLGGGMVLWFTGNHSGNDVSILFDGSAIQRCFANNGGGLAVMWEGGGRDGATTKNGNGALLRFAGESTIRDCSAMYSAGGIIMVWSTFTTNGAVSSSGNNVWVDLTDDPPSKGAPPLSEKAGHCSCSGALQEWASSLLPEIT